MGGRGGGDLIDSFLYKTGQLVFDLPGSTEEHHSLCLFPISDIGSPHLLGEELVVQDPPDMVALPQVPNIQCELLRYAPVAVAVENYCSASS
jgi:hypothetical protein